MEGSGSRERTSQPRKPPSKFNVYQNPAFVAALTANSFRPSKFAVISVIFSSFVSLIALHRMISWEEGIIDNIRVRSYSTEFARFVTKAMEIVISLVFVGALLAFIKIIFLWRYKVGLVSGSSATKGVNVRTSLTSHQLALLGIQTKFVKPLSESPKGPFKSRPGFQFLDTDTCVPLHQPLTSPKSSSPAKSGSSSFCTPTSKYYSSATSQSPPFQSSIGLDSMASSIPWSNKRGSATKEISTEEDLNLFLENTNEKIIGSAGKISTPPTVNGPASPTMSGSTRNTALRPVRMSPNTQKLTTSPRKLEGEIPSPMSMKDIDEAFDQLGIYPQIEQWRDSLRQWFSSVLLNPLVKKIETSHVQVMQSAAKLGISITISQVGCNSQADKTPVNVSSRTKEWLPTFTFDEDGMLHQLRAILVQKLGSSFCITTPSLQISAQQSSLIPLIQECVDAITEHQRLHLLMKGDWAKGLLPQGNVHADYSVRRIHELAEGTCVKNFEYLGDEDGYDKVNRKCTSEFHSDSHLLLYLFCAFLEHPKWMLHVDPNSNTGSQSSNNPLFLGVLPPKERFPEKSIAIISGAPSILHYGASIMAVERKSPPVFALYWDKKIQFSLQGRSALWDSILLLCHRIKTGYGGIIQGVHMASPAINILQILDS